MMFSVYHVHIFISYRSLSLCHFYGIVAHHLVIHFEPYAAKSLFYLHFHRIVPQSIFYFEHIAPFFPRILYIVRFHKWQSHIEQSQSARCTKKWMTMLIFYSPHLHFCCFVIAMFNLYKLNIFEKKKRK